MRVTATLAGGVFLVACGQVDQGLSFTEPLSPETETPPPVVVDEEPPPEPPPPPEVPPPIVLMHGMAGWDEIAGIEYFYGVEEALWDRGYAAFTPAVDPFNSVEVRAAQAAEAIDEILASTGANRVHLIAHSQGGLDARYLVASLGYGDRVATITTISTPHHGTKMGDAYFGLVPGFAGAAAAAIADAFAGWITGTESDLEAQLWGMSHSYVEETFNPENPDDLRVDYYSYAGVTQPWIWVDTSTTDIVNPALLSTYWLLTAIEGDNDGMVSVESSRWGTYLGELPADHIDEMGHVAGLQQEAFDHLFFYCAVAAFVSGDGAPPSY